MTGKQLKNSILQLAIQGKLVPQDPHDEPASELLKRIRKEKELLVKTGKLKKKDLESTPIAEEDKPFEIPESWEWCRLGEIIKMLSGQDLAPSGYNDNQIGIPYITGASNLKNNSLIINRWTPTPTVKAHDGDLLIVCKGSGVGKMAYCTESEVHIARQIQCIVNEFHAIHLGYIKVVISYFLDEIVGQANGLIPGIARDVLLLHVLPLPPLSEQYRIVEKIEELMPLVEEYDKAQSELDKLNESLPEQLKKSILQQAIMGKLVPQDPNDEPASELLKRIHKEKENLVKSGALKKKDLITTPISDDEKPFEIPESWEWVRLKDICVKIVDGDHNPPSGLSYKTNYFMLSSKNINDNHLVDLDSVRFLDEETFNKENERTRLTVGDILFTSVGSIGRSCIVTEPLNICFQRSVSVLTTKLLNTFLKYQFDSPFIQQYIIDNATGTAQKGFYLNQMEQLVIAVPPLSEQHRIVAKIEELFSILK